MNGVLFATLNINLFSHLEEQNFRAVNELETDSSLISCSRFVPLPARGFFVRFSLPSPSCPQADDQRVANNDLDSHHTIVGDSLAQSTCWPCAIKEIK